MRLRTNPDYDLAIDASEQEWAYVNPVQLNNDIITIANEMLTLAEASVAAQTANKRLRLNKKKLEREADDFEAKLLAHDPLSPSEAKSLKTIAAAIERRVQQGQYHAEVEARRAKTRELEDKIDHNETIVKTADLYWRTADKVMDGIKTHLAYAKHERQNGRYGA